MTDRNHTHDARREDVKPGVLGNDPLDRELDAALARYAAVEPRAGLEGRVLANLRAEPALPPARSPWVWPQVAAMAAAVMILVAASVWISGKETKAVHDRPLTSPVAEVATHKGNLPAIAPTPATVRKWGGHDRRPLRRIVTSAPKLDVFPSPQPLSEQEKMLQDYVADYPEQARLVARALTEALRPDQLKGMAPFPSGGGVADSVERNNDTVER